MLEPHLRDLKNRTTAERNSVVLAKRSRRQTAPFVKRGRYVESRRQCSYAPPEIWHEPSGSGGSHYRIVVQRPGTGYRHVVTPQEIRERLSLLPDQMLQPLEVVQLSEMTRKRRRFPCYGMQWGAALYLYPVELSLVEYFDHPPKPAQRTEARMYGGKWVEGPRGQWRLVWTEAAIKDFYLNNVLIHELGHLLDERNSSYIDRERFAEWFAIQHGYKSHQRRQLVMRSAKKSICRRHHAKR